MFQVITNKNKKIELSIQQLYTLLIKEISKNADSEEKSALIGLHIENLLLQDQIFNTSISELIKLSFLLGYYFRIFKEKNNVQYNNDDRSANSI